MVRFIKDNFVTSLLKYQAYVVILNKYEKFNFAKGFKKLKKPFFLTIKSRYKINKQLNFLTLQFVSKNFFSA